MSSEKQMPVRQAALSRLRQRHDRLGLLASDSLVPLQPSLPNLDFLPGRAAAVEMPVMADRQPEAVIAA